ncbi:hypothetical protein OG589_22730 [Sphaerisporangium sp. NBC_01403]|uniref:hypothetical protein n=1 Tax=Sphaerisporangium sp. NBC_01403 TaxID=2903599 RepID=UPI00324ADAC5
MKITRWVAGGMTLAATAALTLVPAGPAQAFPQGACGHSYRKVATYPIAKGAKDGKAYGTVTLYHSRTAHRKCAIARVAGSYVGKTSYLYVALFVDRNGNKKYDGRDTGVADGSAKYKWFAGPVYAPADNLCVQFTGAVRIGSKPAVHGGTPEGKWTHCG